jgi:hypothetical protein
MKLDQLRKVIREEVRAAIREELQEVLTEAVKIASTPTKPISQTYSEVPKGQPKRWSSGRAATLDEMLQDTRSSLSPSEASDIIGGSGVQKPNFASMMSTQMAKENQGPMPGIDISKLDFVKKAKGIYDLANKKSSNTLS